MKEKYAAPEFEVMIFSSADDVTTTSSTVGCINEEQLAFATFESDKFK